MERDPNRNKDKKISVEEVTRRATEYLKRRKKAPQPQPRYQYFGSESDSNISIM
jgi:hypothetical protein